MYIHKCIRPNDAHDPSQNVDDRTADVFFFVTGLSSKVLRLHLFPLWFHGLDHLSLSTRHLYHSLAGPRCVATSLVNHSLNVNWYLNCVGNDGSEITTSSPFSTSSLSFLAKFGRVCSSKLAGDW
jgi:hypothetical protein